MKFSLRKLYILTVISSLAFASGVFAQSAPISELTINENISDLSATISSNQPDLEVEFFLQENGTGALTGIGSTPWVESNIVIDVEYLIFDYPYALDSNNKQFENIVIKSRNINTGELSDELQSFSFALLLEQPSVTVNFPGWETAEYRQIEGTDQYYPYVKSDGLLTRTPSDAPLYLSLHDMTTNTFSVIEEYSGISGSFSITWPVIEPELSLLTPGNEYEIFISDIPEGTFAVDTGNSEYTLINLGNVPVSSGGGDDDDNQGGGDDDNQGNNGNGNNNSGGNTNNQGGGIIDNTQADILSNGIVPSNCGYNLSKEGGGRMCGFTDAITLIQRIIEYIFILILPIAAIVFAYAGFLYLTSGGSADKRKAAKKAMTSVLIGIIVVMAAWLLVKTLVVALGVNTGASWFYLAN